MCFTLNILTTRYRHQKLHFFYIEYSKISKFYNNTVLPQSVDNYKMTTSWYISSLVLYKAYHIFLKFHILVIWRLCDSDISLVEVVEYPAEDEAHALARLVIEFALEIF